KLEISIAIDCGPRVPSSGTFVRLPAPETLHASGTAASGYGSSKRADIRGHAHRRDLTHSTRWLWALHHARTRFNQQRVVETFYEVMETVHFAEEREQAVHVIEKLNFSF